MPVFASKKKLVVDGLDWEVHIKDEMVNGGMKTEREK